jgi:YHS domain-containing protein
MAALMSFSYFPSSESAYGSAQSSPEPAVVDPICGQRMAPRDAAGYVVYRGVSYYFCSEACHRRFTWQAGRSTGCAG